MSYVLLSVCLVADGRVQESTCWLCSKSAPAGHVAHLICSVHLNRTQQISLVLLAATCFMSASHVLEELWPSNKGLFVQDIFVISHSPSGMETGKSKSEERSKLLTDPVVTGIAYEINKANKQLNQHRLQVHNSAKGFALISS